MLCPLLHLFVAALCVIFVLYSLRMFWILYDWFVCLCGCFAHLCISSIDFTTRESLQTEPPPPQPLGPLGPCHCAQQSCPAIHWYWRLHVKFYSVKSPSSCCFPSHRFHDNRRLHKLGHENQNKLCKVLTEETVPRSIAKPFPLSSPVISLSVQCPNNEIHGAILDNDKLKSIDQVKSLLLPGTGEEDSNIVCGINAPLRVNL